MFRFTIRELVLLTLVVALAVGWWMDRRRLAAPLARLAEYQVAEKREMERRQAEQKLRELEWEVLAAKAVNEYGVPLPRSQLTPEEQKKLDGIRREQLRALEQLEQLQQQNK